MPMQAIISDLHSNMAALTVVLEDIRSKGITEILCLGDVIGYGPEPEEALDLAQGWKLILQGNHEEALLTDANNFNVRARDAINWTRKKLDLDSDDPEKTVRWSFLEKLVPMQTVGNVLYVHGSPRAPTTEYIVPRDGMDKRKMTDIFSRFEHICFVGHSHIPGVYTQEGFSSPSELCDIYMCEPAKKVLINVGSVGQPRDGDNRASYVTFDGEAVVFRRLPYDIERTAKKIYAIPELDRFLGDRLKEGK